ncbi:TetR/AcrR family transcriptional regulator [Lichenicoccus sp.]|uniref:TetR/AcrR family transcriptional regulator n=1 Tax=Lichenicoccus sp. TaxID=2781899 RepID=UPI003D10BE64
MVENTKLRLVAVASDLLDAGGQGAVTLRAVADMVGVSHNAPYRHFRDRSALLAAVAERDFDGLRQAFQAEAGNLQDVGPSLGGAARVLIAYAREHPARYRLLFSDPDLPSAGGAMEIAAVGAFQAFGAIVQRCQAGGSLRPIETTRLTGLIYATLHGAIDLELGGRAREAKGLGSIEATVDLLLDLLAQVKQIVNI